ncbi:MAG: GlsB/YeaQ/YmgE family stress response membrane protein [Rivularia sp. (in: cyanobacteria)]|jgi:uncharacterized membrane protein YeaQ/YmgE (transglycosylase-associated protein family)
MFDIIAWVVLGLIAGAIAKAIYPGHQGGGILATMLLGIIGAFVGGTLFTLLTTGTFALTSSGFSIGGLIVAIIGAMIAVFIWSLITKRTA